MNLQVRTFIKQHNLQAGDAIVAKKIGYRILDHFIIYLGNDYRGHWFIANSSDEGVRRYHEDEILDLVKTFEPIRIRKFNGDQYQRKLAVKRALSQEGQPYSLFGSNCEHFANYVQTTRKESPQVSFWLFTAVTALIIGISYGKG